MHKSAFGITVKKADLPEVIKNCNEMLPVSELETIYPVDWEIPADKLKKDYVEEVAQSYKIWGNDVPQPMFAITGIHINATQINGYGETKSFIRFVHNGIPFIKKYCASGEYDRMTMKGKYELVNKKNLTLNIIGQFVLNAWEDKVIPEKIIYYDVEEDTESDYVPTVTKRIKRQSDNLDDWFSEDDDEVLEKKETKKDKNEAVKKSIKKTTDKKTTIKKLIEMDDDDIVF